jgi:hypothetical protein
MLALLGVIGHSAQWLVRGISSCQPVKGQIPFCFSYCHLRSSSESDNGSLLSFVRRFINLKYSLNGEYLSGIFPLRKFFSVTSSGGRLAVFAIPVHFLEQNTRRPSFLFRSTSTRFLKKTFPHISHVSSTLTTFSP